MGRPKKIAALIGALLLAGGAGGAVAATIADNPPTDVQAQSSSSRILGNGISENKFIPIVPCRILDTRQAVAGKLAVGSTRNIDVRGSEATFVQQGGNPGGCGIPSRATAIEATITAVDAGSGFLRAWPASLTQPNATFMNYTSGFNASNTGSITICGYAGQPCLVNQDLSLRAYGSATHLVIDVAGYYLQPMAANVSGAGALVRSSRATAANRVNAGDYTVTFDRPVNTCTYFANTATANSGIADGFATVTNFGGNANAVYVRTFDENGANVDLGFQVEVVC